MFRRFLCLSIVLLAMIFFYVAQLPIKMVLNSIVSSDYLTNDIMSEIRQDLVAQPRFNKLLQEHQGEVSRYIYRTPLVVYTTIDFGLFDDYAVYINNQRHWVVRLGLLPDKNAEVFFPNQIGGVTGVIVGWLFKLINLLLEYGILNKAIYHITDSAETSFMAPSYKPVYGLVK